MGTMSMVSKPEESGVSRDASNGEETRSVGIDPEAEKALNRLKSSEAVEWLGASPAWVEYTKQASEGLFSLTANYLVKAPLRKLYTDRFDAEQIWQQIDMQAVPALSYIRRRVKILEKVSIDDYFVLPEDPNGKKRKPCQDDPGKEQELANGKGSAIEGRAVEESDGSEEEMDELEDVSGSEEEDDVPDDAEANVSKNPVEDEFFKISEMEKFLDKADAEENGLSTLPGSDGEEDEDEDAEAGFSERDEDEEDGEGEELGFGKYEEFFGKDKKQKVGFNLDNRNGVESDDGPDAEDMVSLETKTVPEEKLSAHEKRILKMKKSIEYLEKLNLGPKDWTLQGEVTARKRPKNSALEVEFDFDHNARPPPVITEEITASLEDMIKARIAEGRFDNVKRRHAFQEAAPREWIELDENRSQKGLGELYEAGYMKQTGSAIAPTTETDALKSEATVLFKALCGRLDSLCHYNFAPKPVIEDMGVRAHVPALAMEEVAPLAVSDASMLAPEEVFKGEDGLKAEGELTPEERKRRRAQKKRKRKGETRALEKFGAKKRSRPLDSAAAPKDPSRIKGGNFSSTKVFAALDERGKAPTGKPQKQLPRASDLKL